jgi:hypothetical protein
MTPPYGGFFINENYRQLTKITVNFRVNIYVRQDTKKLTKKLTVIHVKKNRTPQGVHPKNEIYGYETDSLDIAGKKYLRQSDVPSGEDNHQGGDGGCVARLDVF